MATKVGRGLPSLRQTGELAVLEGAFRSGCERFGFRLVQYSVLGHELHLVVEAEDRRALFRGLVGLFVRIARRLNRWWGRKGQVFPDRFRERILRTPREVWATLGYVLRSGRWHGYRVAGTVPDRFSSGRWFAGWYAYRAAFPEPRAVARARTWLLSRGWRRHGTIPLAL